MKCPFCHDLENRVIDSRLTKDGGIIRRRRECLHCKRRFTTYERVEEMLPMVVKEDGRREVFDWRLGGAVSADYRPPRTARTKKRIVLPPAAISPPV